VSVYVIGCGWIGVGELCKLSVFMCCDLLVMFSY